MNLLALGTEVLTALLTLAGIAYALLALLGARQFARHGAQASAPPAEAAFAPGISILKPVKGMDPRMYAGFVSHCLQEYEGPSELLFGVPSLHDLAVPEIARLRVEHPGMEIRLIECPERLGANGKVSTLAQLLPHAQFEHVLVNDSDIAVSPQYLQHVIAPFTQARMGLVTVPYVGGATGTVWSRLEALGISTDFMPGVLAARHLERGLRFGLGSTLLTTKSALAAVGGFQALVDQLADDYELGARLHAAGWRVELVNEVVATSVPAYAFRGFCEHQLRWARSTRDSRRAGYLGLGVTYVLPWALLTVLSSGGALWSFSLLSLALLVRVALALRVGVGLLRDGQVLRDLPLLPLRDCLGLWFWLWSYASDEMAAEALDSPETLGHLVSALRDDRTVVAIRAANALKKVQAAQPTLLMPHARALLRACAECEDLRTRWNLTIVIGGLPLRGRDKALAVDLLFEALRSESRLLRTFALTGLVNLACADCALRIRVRPIVQHSLEAPSAAMRARARKLLKRLKESSPGAV